MSVKSTGKTVAVIAVGVIVANWVMAIFPVGPNR